MEYQFAISILFNDQIWNEINCIHIHKQASITFYSNIGIVMIIYTRVTIDHPLWLDHQHGHMASVMQHGNDGDSQTSPASGDIVLHCVRQFTGIW